MKKDTLTIEKLIPYFQKDNNTVYPLVKVREIIYFKGKNEII